MWLFASKISFNCKLKGLKIKIKTAFRAAKPENRKLIYNIPEIYSEVVI